MPLSPMMKQYLKTKENYKDCILLYRLGDFYEMFYDDAVKVSAMLGLALTGRDCGMDERAPMCGIPYHAVDNYLYKLINNGCKVAICEQLTEPGVAKLVERDVVKVITAGTVMDEKMLDENKNNYIVNIYGVNSGFGLAYADISTGDFNCLEYNKADYEKFLTDFLIKLNPSEIICNEAVCLLAKDYAAVKYEILPKFNSYYEWTYNYDSSLKSLLNQLNVLSLKAFECEDKKLAISAAGSLIEYIKETQKRALSHINSIKYVKDKSYMTIDSNSFKNLEIMKTNRDGKKTGSLLWLIDNTKTNMGARKLVSWLEKPLQSISEINDRLSSVEELNENFILRENLIKLLGRIFDLERLVARISYGNVSPKDLIAVKNTLLNLPLIKAELNNVKSQLLSCCNEDIFEFKEIAELLQKAIIEEPPYLLKNGGFIKPGFSEELDEIKNASKNGKQWLINFEAEEKEKTGIKNLKVGFNKIFGYYIEISKNNIANVPYNYTRKQTIAGGERYITQELKEMENKILGAEELSIKLEQKLFNDIINTLSKNIVSLQTTAKSIAAVDALLSLSVTAIKNKYCKPQITNDGIINIKDGRHPVVEALLKNDQFIANDTYLNCSDDRIMILTGPNMAGKSTYMRQIALITLLAHIGSFVPAREASISLTDRIFTRVGASDNLIFDQSTFMVEMVEVANILANCTNNSLIILDEVGRGTSTFDGLSIAWSIMEYISKNLKTKTLFATHFHELTELEGTLTGAKNYRITVKEFKDSIIFLRKIVRGGANKSFGIEVASLAGLPKQVISRAKEILAQLEQADINNSKNKAAQFFINLDNNNAKNPSEPDLQTRLNSDIIESIENTDITVMTPVDAFKFLLLIKERLENNK